jgi:hypothetical protein
MRQVRAVVLMAGALVAIAVVSFTYLRPGVTAHPASPRTVLVQQPNTPIRTLPMIVSTNPVDGQYFTWTRRSGSGGHAP